LSHLGDSLSREGSGRSVRAFFCSRFSMVPNAFPLGTCCPSSLHRGGKPPDLPYICKLGDRRGTVQLIGELRFGLRGQGTPGVHLRA